MVSIFDLVKHSLTNLSLQTELLEACDWDEDLLSSSLSVFSEVLQNESICGQSYKDIFISIETKLEKKLGFRQSKIMMKMIECHRKEMIDLMNAPES
tara:strand:+ start:409 stop:699 length:291 start_codon:yes stop_codon:yes gene_type:complete